MDYGKYTFYILFYDIIIYYDVMSDLLYRDICEHDLTHIFVFSLLLFCYYYKRRAVACPAQNNWVDQFCSVYSV
jgi:hypothetical protein